MYCSYAGLPPNFASRRFSSSMSEVKNRKKADQTGEIRARAVPSVW